jgi:hypothetical protein
VPAATREAAGVVAPQVAGLQESTYVLRMMRLSLVLLAVLAAGCDAFRAPDRYYNDDVRPPTVAPLDVAALRPGQHVAGTLRLTLRLDSLAGRVDDVVLFLDGEEVERRTEAPYVFTLATEQHADGEHEVAVGVYERTPRGGLLSAIGAPDLLLGRRIVFDQRPPAPVALAPHEVEGHLPRIRWEVSADANFYAYVIYRAEGRVSPELGWDARAIDTLYDQAATSYLGAALPDVLGEGATFRVGVFNRRTTALSDTAYATFGESDVDLNSPGGRTALSPDRGEAYVVRDGAIRALSTSARAEARALPIPSLAGEYYAPHFVQVDPADGRVFAAVSEYAAEWTMRVVDPATFTAAQTYRLPYGAQRFALGGDGRLFAVGLGRLHVLDAATGAPLASTGPVFSQQEAQVAGRSPDGRSVYVMEHAAAGAALWRVDVSGAEPVAAERFAWQGWNAAWHVAVAPDGRVLALMGYTVVVLDGATLQQVRTFNPGPYPRGLLVWGGRIFALSQVPTWDNSQGGELMEFDPATFARIRTWRFTTAPYALAEGGPGELYLFGPRDGLATTWVVRP